MRNRLIRRVAMFATSVIAITVLFAVPAFAGSTKTGSVKHVVEGVSGPSTFEITALADGVTISDAFGVLASAPKGGRELCVYVKASGSSRFDITYDGVAINGVALQGFTNTEFEDGYTVKNENDEYVWWPLYPDSGKDTDSEDVEEDDDDDDDDDDSSSGGMSFEERQREAERHFAPDASTLTPEQSAGWSLVSREAPAISSGAGVAATSAYQGPMCRLVFQLAAPGYSIGHTYNMSFRSIGGNASMNVPTDLARSGRRFVLTFVTSDGRYVSTPALTADGRGYLNFDLTGLGLTANTNNAVAIMYQD